MMMQTLHQTGSKVAVATKQKSPADDTKEPYRRRKRALQISPRWSFKLAKDAIMMQTLHKTGSKVGGGDEMGVTTHGE